MFEKFSKGYLINSAFIEPSDTSKVLVSPEQFNCIQQIYANSNTQPLIKIPKHNTHFEIEKSTELPQKTIRYPNPELYFNAKQREYLLATPDSAVHKIRL